MSKPTVAIVGRQNVGKSTLLNRLAGKPVAIVEDLPGTTRDRVFADVSWQGVDFIIVDTGGLELEPRSTIAREVKEQVEVAIAEAEKRLCPVLPLSGFVCDNLLVDFDCRIEIGNCGNSTFPLESVSQFENREIRAGGHSFGTMRRRFFHGSRRAET